MLGLIADSVIEDFLVVLEQDCPGPRDQAALRQASVDNHAVVVEPGRLPEGRRSLTLLRSGSGKTKMVGLSKLEACTAAGVLDSGELRAVDDPRGRQSCLCDYPAH